MDKIYRARRKRARHIRTQSGRVFRQRLGAIFTLVLFAGVLSIAGVIGASFLVYHSYASDLQNPQDEIDQRFVGPSFAFDRNGQQLGEYVDKTAGLRHPVPLNQISPFVIAATVATEDSTFYTNPGVNFKGLARAAWENLTPFGGGGFFGGTGGSSITQQLVKNVYTPEINTGVVNESTSDKINRKLKESVVAIELKRQYSNDQILDWYLGQIFYGRNANGIEAASEAFFGKKAKDLTLGEAAYLAGLPQAPGDYAKDADSAKRRQGEVLDLMISHLDDINKIPTDGDETKPLVGLTVDQINAARDEPLNFIDTSFSIQAPHFFYYLQDQVTKMCQAGLFSAPGDISCDEVVTQGGLKITSTLDLGLNALVQKSIEDQISAYEDGTNGHDASSVTIDPKTGEILAYIGSRNFNDDHVCDQNDPDSLGCEISGQVDIASSEQSLGSTMKMFTYLKAFEDGWVPSTFIDDKELILDPGTNAAHKINNWNSSYLGTITIRKAMSESVNTAAVRTLLEVGEDGMRDMAHRMGITDLRQGNCGPTITLGACEVKLVDQTFAYAVLANGGDMIGRPTSEDLPSGFRELDPVSVLKITDNDGNVLYNFDKPETRHIVDPAYAYMITDIASNDGINWSRLTIDRPAATKTGTSEEFRDGVIMGYTPDLVTGVWMGNANNNPMTPGTFSAQGVGPIWREVMTEASQYLNLPKDDFKRPDDVILLDCNGRREVFKVNTPTVKAGACHGPSGHDSGASASPTPKGPVFPTRTEPPSTTPTPVPTETPVLPAVTYYKTQEGDTVQSVANKYRVGAADLAKANAITITTPLQPGTILVIPLSSAQPSPAGSPTPVPEPTESPQPGN
ncbi:MAG: transglycosylase domain-containing protein [Chloroflexota bacterium]